MVLRWSWTRAGGMATREPQTLVLTVTDPVTRATAGALVARVGRIAGSNPVVIDLTAIPEFDSDGAAAIIGLQESFGSDRIGVVGFRQAAARIIGADELEAVDPPTDGDQSGWVVRRLRSIAVVQPDGLRAVTTDDLEPAVTDAIETRAGIVVVDLRGVRLTRAGLQTIAFASSTAALNGQELLVVNVDEQTGERLRRAGLSRTTYVAPEPLTDN
jgi:anti-anti-sigma regulatory factor